MIAYKFVKWDVDPLIKLFGSFPYLLKEKVLSGEKLDREEKDQLFAELNNNVYSQQGIALGGWVFDFSSVLKVFFVEYKYGGIDKKYAPDKMAIRNNICGIKKIVEVN